MRRGEASRPREVKIYMDRQDRETGPQEGQTDRQETRARLRSFFLVFLNFSHLLGPVVFRFRCIVACPWALGRDHISEALFCTFSPLFLLPALVSGFCFCASPPFCRFYPLTPSGEPPLTFRGWPARLETLRIGPPLSMSPR